MLLIGFLTYRITVLSLRQEYKLTTSVQENHFDLFPGFSLDDGFKVAAGVVTYNGSVELIEDPEIGTLKFYIKYYQHPVYGTSLDFFELESTYCDPEKDFNDIEGGNTESGFYPIHP